MNTENKTQDTVTEKSTTAANKFARGDLVSLSDLAVVLEPGDSKEFAKVVAIRKDGTRWISSCDAKCLSVRDPRGITHLGSLVHFYDKCAEFVDGAKVEGSDPDIEALIQAARPKAFELLRNAATTIREFDAPTNYSLARVLLDFAERSGAGFAAIERCRVGLDDAKRSSRAQLDLDRYYRMLRDVGYDPTVTGFDGRVGIHMSIGEIRDDRHSEINRVVENADLDFVLRSEYIRAAWEKREPGASFVTLGV